MSLNASRLHFLEPSVEKDLRQGKAEESNGSEAAI